MKKLQNLTPHPIVINGHTIHSSGVARVKQETNEVGYIETEFGRIPITVTELSSNVLNLPEPVEGVFLIVSAIVRQALPDRPDLASPSGLIRDEAGRIVGCESLDIENGWFI